MQKDYAKYTFKQNHQLVEHGWRYRLLIVIFVISFACFVGYAYYLYDKYSDQWSVAKIKSFFVHKQSKNSVPSQIVTNQEKKQENDIQFSFYTELSNKQVMQATETERVVPVITDNSKKGQYVVQVAAFKNPSAAGEMRISLLLAGFEVDMVKSVTEDHQPLYLIQQGPYQRLEQAKSMQQKMKQKGIESVVKKIT